MKKIKIIIALMLLGKLLNAQCEYFDDPSTFRVNGTVSAPACSGSFTHCSKNGFSISPYGNYRVLNLMINIIYDQSPGDDPLAGATGYWNPGTANTINSNTPVNLNSFMDDNFTTIPPQGIFTRKYYESSFGAMHIAGDFVVVDVLQSQVNAGSTFLWDLLVNKAIDVINNSGGLSTIYGHNSIGDYDFGAPGNPGLPKSATPNGKIDFVQVLMRNSTTLYGGRKIGEGITGFGSLFGTTILINGSYYDAESVSIQGVGNGQQTNPNGIIVHELAHNLFGGNDFHTSGGHHYGSQPFTTFLGIQGGYGLMGSAGAGLTSVNSYERYRMGWYSPTYNIMQLPIQANNVVSDIDQSNGSQSFILRDFVTTGDAIRIKLPYKDASALDQYIWLENHKIGINGKLDFLQFSDSDPQCRTMGQPGVYAYTQVGKNILESNNQADLYPSGYEQADNLRIISAEGNYDHVQLANGPINCVAWPTSETYQEMAENSLTGSNDQMHVFYDNIVSNLGNCVEWSQMAELSSLGPLLN